MVNLQVVLLSSPTSLASIMVIGPHHAAVTYVGDSSEVRQREHVLRLGIHRKCWSEFLCLGAYLARRPPPMAPRRWARGRSPIGYRAARCQTALASRMLPASICVS
jgi:hypothetical protein